jgi:hypothetical protein
MRFPRRGTPFDDSIYERIMQSVQPGDELVTLRYRRSNRIIAIDRDGITVLTQRSE